MATEFRWLKTIVYANPKTDLDWDVKTIGTAKKLQYRDTGWFMSGWQDIDIDTEYVYVDEIQPVKIIGLVEDYTKG